MPLVRSGVTSKGELKAARKFLQKRVRKLKDRMKENLKKMGKRKKGAYIGYTWIFVLDPDYVRKHAKEDAIARTSWFYNFNYNQQASPFALATYPGNRVRGVRREVVAEIGNRI